MKYLTPMKELLMNKEKEKEELMKRFLVIPLVVCFLLVASVVSAATLNLTATWTLNTEPDMKEYRLYRTDVPPAVLIGTITHPNSSFDFTTTAPDNQDYTLTFVLYAVDVSDNVSPPSNTAPFFSNLKPPDAPGGLGVQEKQNP